MYIYTCTYVRWINDYNYTLQLDWKVSIFTPLNGYLAYLEKNAVKSQIHAANNEKKERILCASLLNTANKDRDIQVWESQFKSERAVSVRGLWLFCKL